jgi:hypothetical protein
MVASAVALTVRGKRLAFSKHAAQAMWCERPPIDEWDVLDVLEHPDEDTKTHGARRRFARRTIIVRYHEDEETLHVRTVSASRSR